MMTSLDAGQQGTLAKVLATAVARAAAALDDMIADGVTLSAPPPQAGLRHEAAERLAAVGGDRPCVAVKQRFRGRFSGDALLIFPEKDGRELVRAILAEAVPLEAMTELEQDALVEVGNVVLNASLSSIAVQFGERLHGGVPQSVRGAAERVCESRGGEADERRGDLMLLQRLDFTVAGRRFLGFLALTMDSLSADVFRRLLAATAPPVNA
jgi:chemotaxis protein CheC